MWLRRVFVGCGAVFLAMLMLICTLSFGIYFGERGVMRGRAQQTPAGRTPPSAAAPLAAPGGPPNVIGTLQRYGDNTITLATMQGPRTVGLTPQTTVRRENAAAPVSDLRPGMALAVWGDPGAGGRVLNARVIVILAPQQQ
jgi:hypothetical protein